MQRDDALSKLTELMQKSKQPTGYEGELWSWMVKRKTATTLWLIGASYAQLSVLFSASRPTIRQWIVRETSADSTRFHRATSAKDRMSFDAVSWYLERLRENVDRVAATTADQLAVWVTTEYPYTGD